MNKKFQYVLVTEKLNQNVFPEFYSASFKKVGIFPANLVIFTMSGWVVNCLHCDLDPVFELFD